MRTRRSSLSISAAILACGILPALQTIAPTQAQGQSQPTPRQSLLVLSKHDHTLSIVDPTTLKVVGRAPVGPDPHEVVASSDGKTAYVSIYGGGAYHILNVIDLIGQKALPDIDTGALNGPHGLDFAGGKVWFTAEGAKAIARYDPATSKIDWIMGTGQNRTHMLYVTAGEKQIYTTNVNAATVSVIELTPQQLRPPPMRPGQHQGGPPPGSQAGGPPPGGPGGPGGPPRMDWNQTVIPVGKGDEGFDVSPDGRELWTANAQDGTLSVIDIPGKRVVATLDAKTFGANRLKFTLDGKHVLISMLGDTDLVIYNASTRTEEKRVKIGHGAAGILMQPDGTRAFISCGPDNYVAVLDLKTLEVTGHIEAGGEPDGLAWATQN
ncbi:MAG TPA: YncE family protein [Acidobacteriaceae bacterium]|jgi:DNA-binding beta-propeller fold protein YncE|nr:YncE family protein [Acidobacteriaceae bacterium]